MEKSEGETTTTTTINGKQQQQYEEEDDGDVYSTNDTNNPNNTNDTKTQFKDSSMSLYDAVSSLLSQIFFPDHHHSSSSFFQRSKSSLKENIPHIREASTATGLNLLKWARQGSHLRLLLVLSVGSITLLTLTGVLLFLLFVAAATVNAIVLSLFVSLAAAGGVLAIFFACVAGIYIGALSIAAFVIFSATISAIITILVVTGWIGFFWSLWLVVKKGVSIAKHSVTVTGSALTAYTSGRHVHHHDE